MARADKTTTCPTCGGTFQLRGAGSHFIACAARAGKPVPLAPVVDEPAPVAPLPAARPTPVAPAEPAAGRPVGRPRFQSWKGGARG